MKAKISRGGGFRGALNYVLDVGKDATGDKMAEIVGGTMITRDAAGMSREFSAVRQLRPDIKKPVWHCSLSLPPGDKLSSSKWQEVAEDFMQEMGFPADTQYTVVRHGDTDKDHVHIVASRISLSGNVWHGKFEAYEAINATQRLEQKHGLTLTPGLGSADKENQKQPRVRLTTEELSKAERQGVQPARLVVFDAIMRQLERGKQTLTDFIRGLREDGVHVVPKISSQKKVLQGLSFEHEGLVFAGGKVATGHSFTLGRLQGKWGVSYEPSRDDEEVTNAARIATERRGDRAASSLDTTRTDSATDSNSNRAVGLTPPSIHARPEPNSTAANHGNDAEKHEQQHERSANKARSMAEEQPNSGERNTDRSDSKQQDSGVSSEANFSGSEVTRANYQNGRSGQQNSKETAMENSANKQSSVGHADSGGSSWNTRFKQASAARRRAKDGTTSGGAGRMATATELKSAKSVDPTAYLESAGYVVTRQGKHLSVRTSHGDEVYRITEQSNGHYVACDRYQNGIGDNISLVQHIEPGTSFSDAVYRLNGGKALAQAIHPEPQREPRTPPRMPRQADQSNGRAYLQARGADSAVIAHAEKCGFVRYLEGAVVFCGYDDEGTIQNATRRATKASDPVQRRDFRGSDKQYAPVLPGDKGDVWIVEGGVDALAAQTLALKQGKPQPTVIVSGGAGVRSWLESKHIQKLLTQANSITLTTDAEKNDKVQAETDRHHQRQIERITEITGRKPEVWKPRHGAGDLADYVQSGAYEKDAYKPKTKKLQPRAPQQRRYHGSASPQPQRPKFK